MDRRNFLKGVLKTTAGAIAFPILADMPDFPDKDSKPVVEFADTHGIRWVKHYSMSYDRWSLSLDVRTPKKWLSVTSELPKRCDEKQIRLLMLQRLSDTFKELRVRNLKVIS